MGRSDSKRCSDERLVLRDLDPLARILAYFAADGKFSYIDMLSSAVNPLTAVQAVGDAIRDFYSSCGVGGDACKQKYCPKCPCIDSGALQKAISRFIDCIEELEQSRVLVLLRGLAARALSLVQAYVCQQEEKTSDT